MVSCKPAQTVVFVYTIIMSRVVNAHQQLDGFIAVTYLDETVTAHWAPMILFIYSLQTFRPHLPSYLCACQIMKKKTPNCTTNWMNRPATGILFLPALQGAVGNTAEGPVSPSIRRTDMGDWETLLHFLCLCVRECMCDCVCLCVITSLIRNRKVTPTQEALHC